MQDITVALLQCPLHWEDREANLSAFSERLKHISAGTHLIVFPEMFSTGFSMNGDRCAEAPGGRTFLWLQNKAAETGSVIACSMMVQENGALFNRFLWVRPDGSFEKYNKKHLFRFGNEHKHFSAGNELTTVELHGWKFRPMVCYDLRFPVWSRNTYSDGNFGYDCLLYVANWPEKRRHHWMSLLTARAIENLSYSIGVNRTGTDGNGVIYSGDSLVTDPTGQIAGQCSRGAEEILTITLSAVTLLKWRAAFNAGQDWDQFRLL